MTDTMSTTDSHKAAKPRSPNFPAIPLDAAVQLVERVYKAENTGFAPVRVIVTKHWGFAEKSSAWKIRMAAVTSFGLFEAKGEGDAKEVRISDLAKRILLDRVPGSQERLAALRKAALRPSIYKDIRERWGAQLGSDATLETYLVRDRGFTDAAARVVLEGYKKTIAYAEMDRADSIPVDPGESAPAGAPSPVQPAQAARVDTSKPKPRAPAPPGMRDLPITLPSLAVATIQVPLPMSETDFTFLANTLAALRAALTAPPPTPSPQPSEDEEDRP